MTSKTLSEYLHLLKPKHQEYILFCVVKWSDREGFHRALLPFLPVPEATRYLKFQLERLKEEIISPDETLTPRKGVKFIHHILSLLEASGAQKLCEDKVTIKMQLSTVCLAREYGRRFNKRFCVTISYPNGRPQIFPTNIVELNMVGKDIWAITCHPKVIDRVTTWLAETYR